ESALAPTRWRALHAQVLHALIDDHVTNSVGHRGGAQVSLARLVHHAAATENATLVLRFTPEAAKQASSQGAHREAAAHYQTALRYADRLAAEPRAELLDGLSYELALIEQMEDAVQSCEAALALWRALARPEQVGRMLRRLSRVYQSLGKHEE